MFVCTSCNKELEEGTLICPDCGNHVAVNAKRAKLENLKLNTKSITANSFGSVLFLVLSIAISIIALGNVISAFSSFGSGGVMGVLSGLVSLALCTFPVLATVGSWMTFASAKGDFDAGKLGLVKIYPKFQHVMNIIAIVLTSIVSGILLIVLFIAIAIGGEFYYEMADMLYESGVDRGVIELMEVLFTGTAVIAVLITVIVAAVIVYMVFYAKCYKRIHAHIGVLQDSVNTGVYNTSAKAPFISIFVVCGISILFSSFATGFLSVFGLANFGTLSLDFIEIAYLVVFAIFFKSIAKKQTENANLLAVARAELDEAIKATEAEVALSKKQKHDADEEAMHKMQEQQNQLFQQMFSNMMAQQQAAAAANNANADNNQ